MATGPFNGQPALSLSVNNLNRITNSGFTYNNAGDETADGALTFTWNAEERLTSTAGVNYTHDGDGWRVKKDQVSGSTYDKLQWRSLSGEILVETDLAGNTPTEYIYFAGRRIARRDNSGTVYYFLQDHLGSTRVIASSTGSIVRESDYYPFGGERVIGTPTVDDPHKFAGMYLDGESGLYHTWFRMYSPSVSSNRIPQRETDAVVGRRWPSRENGGPDVGTSLLIALMA